jgi:hypothetical protein
MAKKKRMPKKPKKSSSIETWKNWEKRAAVVKKYNDGIDKVRNEKDKIANKFR